MIRFTLFDPLLELSRLVTGYTGLLIQEPPVSRASLAAGMGTVVQDENPVHEALHVAVIEDLVPNRTRWVLHNGVGQLLRHNQWALLSAQCSFN